MQALTFAYEQLSDSEGREAYHRAGANGLLAVMKRREPNIVIDWNWLEHAAFTIKSKFEGCQLEPAPHWHKGANTTSPPYAPLSYSHIKMFERHQFGIVIFVPAFKNISRVEDII